MNIMKRWTTSLTSSFDWVISQVENHDALVTGAIREMQVAGSKARVQLDRVRRDGEKMRRRVFELDEILVSWEDRAVRSAADREKALECLRRKRTAEREQEHLRSQIAEHVRVEAQLSKDMKTIEERIQELKRKKNTLSARQYRAEAMKAGQLGELGLITEIDDIFDRWEMKLGQYESTSVEVDELAEEFETAEDIERLEAELRTLLKREAEDGAKESTSTKA
ncbi:MAG: PspA/IM30 family protein [Deltaproteobacteria bacterium]|nr:PspA/IM30 family protein [Deltaproteobacteria bacterium]